jgi:hypothetical protein
VQNALASMLDDGRGGPQDEVEARRLYGSPQRREFQLRSPISEECSTMDAAGQGTMRMPAGYLALQQRRDVEMR